MGTSFSFRYEDAYKSPREVINRREELRYLLRNSIYNNLTDMQLDDSRMSAVEKRYMIFEDPDGYERYISRKKSLTGQARMRAYIPNQAGQASGKE